MMGSRARREQFKAAADSVGKAVKQAGALVVAALVVACVALAVALGALVLAVRTRPVTP